MTDPKLPYDVDEENARVKAEFDRYLGVFAPKRDACTWCDPVILPNGIRITVVSASGAGCFECPKRPRRQA